MLDDSGEEVVTVEGLAGDGVSPLVLATDFERMRNSEGWHHSTLEKIEVTRVSDAQAHCEVTYSRFKKDGAKYRTGSGLYLITRQDGHWGMQLRAFAPVVEK